MLYFAYASNLNKDHMLSRCPDAIPIKKVSLKGYTLIFNELADIIEDKGDEVLGAIYVISKEELEILDTLEGYPDLYNRIGIEVSDEKGNTYEAFAYIMIEKDPQSPPDHYYNLLSDGYKDWDLPMEKLEKAKEQILK
ncbi:gamma-glutamylcyclotransferase family protein [Tissierella creatinophila]|uniref:AIG2-like family protein n=1 Tax=Tissierella creatinophila DSM 6911 TaxID=1123403 RepID=A0A1U7M795_TISCR|nr:gamma-glutamylcyclotransferase family protein [Tissierella creatinophila]OLS03068.1 AIG2-like family protein [Tissierella creatinophila DSM 6911]